jgi:hypothetical protein
MVIGLVEWSWGEPAGFARCANAHIWLRQIWGTDWW